MAIHKKFVETSSRDFFLVSSGAEIRPLSQLDLGDFFSQFEKKFQIPKKNIFFFFFLEFSFSHHTHTHKLHDDNLPELHPIFLQLMAIVCVIANFVFKLTKNAVLVCLENFPK